MNENQIELLNALIENNRKKGYVSLKEILSIVDEDTEEFDEAMRKIDDEGITIADEIPTDDFKMNIDLENLEDDEFAEFLEKELNGYTEYKKKVKYRIIPFIW